MHNVRLCCVSSDKCCVVYIVQVKDQ